MKYIILMLFILGLSNYSFAAWVSWQEARTPEEEISIQESQFKRLLDIEIRRVKRTFADLKQDIETDMISNEKFKAIRLKSCIKRFAEENDELLLENRPYHADLVNELQRDYDKKIDSNTYQFNLNRLKFAKPTIIHPHKVMRDLWFSRLTKRK